MLKMTTHVKVDGKNRSIVTTMKPDASCFQTALMDFMGHTIEVICRTSSYKDALDIHDMAVKAYTC